MKPWLSEQAFSTTAASLGVCQHATAGDGPLASSKLQSQITPSQAIAPQYRALTRSETEFGKETVRHFEEFPQESAA